MGLVFENLLRRFQEDWDAGEHFTPRDIVRLMTKLVIVDDEFDVDKTRVNEERRAYLEEARSQEASE